MPAAAFPPQQLKFGYYASLLFALFTLLAFVLYMLKFGIDRDYRFEVAAIIINWLVSIAVGILIGICMRRKMKAAGT